jgi:signal peptidase II
MLINSKNIKISKKTVIFAILAVFFITADRFLEALCLKGYFDRPVPIISNIFSLNYVKNYYIAFSLPFSGFFLNILIGVIILALLISLIRMFNRNTKDKIQNTIRISLFILLIGAVLNFADRLQYGFVIDYFYLKYFTVFNLSDIMIFTGVLLLIFNNRSYAKNV